MLCIFILNLQALNKTHSLPPQKCQSDRENSHWERAEIFPNTLILKSTADALLCSELMLVSVFGHLICMGLAHTLRPVPSANCTTLMPRENKGWILDRGSCIDPVQPHARLVVGAVVYEAKARLKMPATFPNQAEASHIDGTEFY